ncbi:MFS transporter [Saccharomonospora cyanea]|uniref:Arabinose efflux permease family protein n=1 Tax=Saccharomonospora cyanea NA-134 TaxID=882082 RepID=H5XEJ1_9PSEU|nr:MFS transporter [Saccharomonospora cyanea]EHR62470.1 arabinose efflux permease family protein [Saccharomonospora cyanea NA-134]
MTGDTLWWHRDFRLLWAGETASQFGTFVSRTVLPVLAVTTLAATPLEMGVLTAAENAAFLVLGLPAGVWVDRVRRRPVMVWADLLRGLLLLTVPVAWWLGVLTLAHLVAVATLVGVATVFFDVAYQSYLPSLVGREKLIEGNAKLQASQSVANVAGPGLAGTLTHLAGAANALVTVGGSYLASAWLLRRIRAEEPSPERDGPVRLRAQVAEGLRFVFGSPALRAITLCTASGNLMGGAFTAVEVLFLTRDLRLSPGEVGWALACHGFGGVLGAVTAGWCLRRIGLVRAVWLVPLLTWPAQLLVPLSEPGWRVTLAGVGFVAVGYGVIVYNVAQVSYRQTLCPDHLLGRMNASVRFVVWGVLPIGGLLGGVLGETLGVRTTVWLTSAGLACSALWALLLPLRGAKDTSRHLVPGTNRERPTTRGRARPSRRTPRAR